MFGSLRNRASSGQNASIYEASEVHDSAEDLREIIERQDRESDRLENVRACCDGKKLLTGWSDLDANPRHRQTRRETTTPSPHLQEAHTELALSSGTFYKQYSYELYPFTGLTCHGLNTMAFTE